MDLLLRVSQIVILGPPKFSQSPHVERPVDGKTFHHPLLASTVVPTSRFDR